MKLAIRLARQSLRSHKLRSRLSTVGIVISVFLVSLIFIVSDSLKASLASQANELSSNSIIVNGASSNRLLNLITTLPDNTLTNDDATEIRNNLSGSHVISNLILNGSVSYDDILLSNITTIATSTVNPDDLNLTIVDGDWFSDNERSKKWVILGENLANRLIGTSRPQSQVIDIKGEKFTVVGVVKHVNQPLSVLGYNVNDTAFISLENGQDLSDDDSLSQLLITNVNNVNDAKLYNKRSITTPVFALAYRYLHHVQKKIIRLTRKYGFEPLHDFEHLRKCADKVLNQGVKMGEGWLIPAEMAALAETGTDNIVCAQPFGCLPNHIAGKGAVRTLKRMYEHENIVAVDYDPSATKVNQENRIKLMLATARENLAAKQKQGKGGSDGRGV